VISVTILSFGGGSRCTAVAVVECVALTPLLQPKMIFSTIFLADFLKKKQTEWVIYYYYKMYLIMLCILYDSRRGAYYNGDILYESCAHTTGLAWLIYLAGL